MLSCNQKVSDLINLKSIKEEMGKQWRYVEKDGNPKEAGQYWVTLIDPEWKDGKKTGKMLAEVDSRYYSNLDEEPDLKGWRMDGEPETGYAWTQETGSIMGERVHAWMPIEDIEIADLPEGVERA